jgi:endo-1,4-beta-xylanase
VPSFAAAAMDGEGLSALATKQGITFGTAVLAAELTKDADYQQAVDREASLITPVWEAKWDALQPQEGVLNVEPLKALVDWAAPRRKVIRGHALVWHVSFPAWAAQRLKGGRDAAISVMASHMDRVLAYTRPFIRDWDVVNEALADPPGSDTPQIGPGDLRRTPWLDAMGPDYIQQAFIMARQRDPTLRLVLNDYGVEEDTPAAEEKRRRFLALIRDLLSKGTPIDAVGVQAHLQLANPFRHEPFQRFVRSLREAGLQVLVTELDIREVWNAPQELGARDALVAERAYAFTSAALDAGIRTFSTWGLSDRYTWLTTEPAVALPHGRLHRGLPLDDRLQRKAMWSALARAFSGGGRQ